MSDQSITATAIPDWFSNAIACEPQSRFVTVEGARIHYLSWNAQGTDKPCLLFAHGLHAHARWWCFVAPFLLDRFRVVALDFSGMGDSDRRKDYVGETFSRDIRGVLVDTGSGKTTLVGHSFGGGCVVRFCANHPELVERAVIIDSYIPVPAIRHPGRQIRESRPNRVYPTFDAARGRFRLVPEDNSAAPYVIDYVARHSIKEVTGGWSWKFDANCWPDLGEDTVQAAAVLAEKPVPLTFVYGDSSIVVTQKLAAAIVAYLPQSRGPIAIPQAHHHVMLDQPLSLVSALRGILY